MRRAGVAIAALALFSVVLAGVDVEELSEAPVARNVVVDGRKFVLSSTKEEIVMSGPNIVVKGPPYLPSVEGEEPCKDVVNDECMKAGTCVSCTTFNMGDINHIKNQGWNAIRLGVTWAGAQPTDSDELDPDFVRRLHAVLDLCDKTGIHVVLDNHGDMVGSAGCGNGVPMWIQRKAAPELIGKPLSTGFPYFLVPSLRIDKLEGYARCGSDAAKWAAHAGDPNYNLKNECCQAINSDNPGAIGFTKISQKTMSYVMSKGEGRDAFVRYWRLIAEVARGHPSAFAVELMNEPMSIHRRDLYDTWRAVAEAVNAVVPDMAVSVTDIGEGAIIPSWVSRLFGSGILIDSDTVKWMKQAKTLYYSWHWYGDPKDPEQAVKNAQAVSADLNMPTFLTEFGDCSAWKAAAAAGISHTYWHYSVYCTTGPWFGNRSVPDETFGACLLGWDSAGITKDC